MHICVILTYRRLVSIQPQYNSNACFSTLLVNVVVNDTFESWASFAAFAASVLLCARCILVSWAAMRWLWAALAVSHCSNSAEHLLTSA
jgi:hypothetical protein